MRIEKKLKKTEYAIRLSYHEGKKEIGRAYLYILRNDLHKAPFGFLEDVFVEKDRRGAGVGTALVKAAMTEAKRRRCYKLLGTSRASRKDVHRFYKRLGFKKRGFEFRIDFPGKK